MALPHLIKYVYNSGTDEVIRRGKKIHAIGYVELMEYDELMGSALFRVKDDSYATYYKVQVQKFRDPKTLSVRCSCPYNLGDICRHESAALFQLQELLDRNMLGNREIAYNQKHTVVKMKQIDLKTIKMLSAPVDFEEAEKLLRTQKVNILSAKEEKVTASLDIDGETFPVVIQKNEERNFDTSCTCNETAHPLCFHKTMLLLQLLHAYGAHYFDTIRNWDKEKNKLLEAYGYSLSDDLKGKFEFTYKDGKPFLRVLDTSIKRLAPAANARLPKPEPEPVVVEQVVEQETEMPEQETAKASSALGVVINLQQKSYPYFLVEAVKGESGENGNLFAGKAEKLDLSKFVDGQELNDADKQLLPQLRRFQETEITKYLNRNSPFSGFWENIVHHEDDDLPEETKSLMVEYLHPKLSKLLNEVAGSEKLFLLPKGKPYLTKNLENIEVAEEPILPEFSIEKNGNGFEMNAFARLNGQRIPLTENETSSSLIFLYNGVLYTWKRPEDVMQAEGFLQQKKKGISKADWPAYLRNTILPLTREYHVQFDSSLVEEVKDGEPEVRLLLQEKGDYLVFQPVFNYKGYDTRAGDKEEIVVPTGEKVWIIHRNRAAENKFMQKLENLHSQFIRPEGGQQLVLKGADVLKNNWFFLFVDAMRDMKVPVLGFDALKNFRFNTAKPSTRIHISSNTDWFDARVEIEFGDLKVTIAEVKRALANKQQFVHLSDGTLGVLPEEWIKKYSLLFRVGEGKTNQLRLSKYHLSVIDELYDNRDEEELMIQLEEKYERLRDSDHRIAEVPPPAHLAPILRPYQTSGFQWLNYLNEVGWGGILADDMGLGKTIQALSFLHHIQATQGKMQALVVCPTTLMYNWENEIKKFTPNLTYIIHHSSMRTRSSDILGGYDVIITTYGTLRSDIKVLSEIAFDYVVLDESQAIKNPASKVTKAASVLKAKNRLCLSGTPLQNNTFDIFAQMNFLNPGMLGSIEFFRQEFAIPIDKFGEQERKEHLRKILYPFILRRTKEQVARDLPEKMETILYCEMEDEQRKIYDAYRNDFRDRILGIIDEQGIQKSQLTILQGLMKLRQICDSPAILNEQEKFPNHSIKLDEIAREITENISNHKALIFSQFLGMLGLIREKMKELGVEFEYFDGSTTATERERAIQHFQNDDKCRVFLISLKAGGVGLNLTAADYVYIVDPWWNPAVEQQAIDRTHRIGQTKNIFAYRMICKDTIEDKILQLQEKKRLLAKDLISDDTGFVKSLSKADVEYLFS
ncbi:DEAD/DEAH box helicase [Parasegetibacter sp. NRK P23]|uniref:DEAD/DEAH box helicase n=1 Tax=Parasegetibacter sp. NRK P23 TaxID=2942999 RepID=UPI002043E28B|nr:DEAD/DEAH box helicase [Parasegetibacter sp. NRK P23]MCM5527948.1 SNF2 family helicase [Parasegetibacter sp. NRK P23]